MNSFLESHSGLIKTIDLTLGAVLIAFVVFFLACLLRLIREQKRNDALQRRNQPAQPSPDMTQAEKKVLLIFAAQYVVLIAVAYLCDSFLSGFFGTSLAFICIFAVTLMTYYAFNKLLPVWKTADKPSPTSPEPKEISPGANLKKNRATDTLSKTGNAPDGPTKRPLSVNFIKNVDGLGLIFFVFSVDFRSQEGFFRWIFWIGLLCLQFLLTYILIYHLKTQDDANPSLPNDPSKANRLYTQHSLILWMLTLLATGISYLSGHVLPVFIAIFALYSAIKFFLKTLKRHNNIAPDAVPKED